MDEAGFRALFGACFDDVWRFARRRCPSSDQADDITAETFAVAWRRRDDLPYGDAARLWLFGTARQVLANQRRGDGRRSALRDRLTADRPNGQATDPAEAVAATVAGQQVWRALAALTDEERDLLLMRAWDGLAVTDIAALLDCTPNAASIRLHRARARLATELDSPKSSGAGQPSDLDASPAGGSANIHATAKEPTASRTRDGRSPTSEGEAR